jgi:hypothetical protein
MIGLLAHGSNHFIVDGPLPDLQASRKLASYWENPVLTGRKDVAIPWKIVTKAFRENLEWAVVLASGERLSTAVEQLAGELAARGVPIHRGAGPWHPIGEQESWSGTGWPVGE